MRIVLVGAGELGEQLIQVLLNEGHSLYVIDNNHKAIEHCKKKFNVKTLLGHGASAYVLQQAHIDDADLFIATTRNDELNMIAAMSAKEFGVPRTAVSIMNEAYLKDRMSIYQNLFGLDLIFNKDAITAEEIAKQIENPGSVAITSFANGKVFMKELFVNKQSAFVNKKLSEINMPKSSLLIGVIKKNKFFIPTGETIVVPGDKIILISENWIMPDIEEMFCVEESIKRPNVFVYGINGGTEALMNFFDTDGIKPVIIDENLEMCEYFSREWPKTKIKYIRNFNKQSLKEIGVNNKVDFFIANTESDERNMLIGMIAKELNVKRIITKISGREFAPIVAKLNIGSVVCPTTNIISNLICIARGDDVLSMAMLYDGQAQIIEVVATDGSRLVGTPIKDLKLPKNTLLCSIVRGTQIIIPHGDNVIHPKDIVIIIAKSSSMPKLEKLLVKGKYSGYKNFFTGKYSND